MKIKPTEYKILKLLEGMDQKLCYAKYISLKLKSPYPHILNTLHGMESKNWISSHLNRNLNRRFYKLLSKAPLGIE